MPFFKWSQTANNNASADSTCPWPEGMAPSQVNDSARGNMAALAQWRDDISGALVTGGTSTAYTVTSNSVYDTLAHLDGQVIAFTPHATNGDNPTLNVDGLGARGIVSSSGLSILRGTLIANTPYVAVYNNANTEFRLHSLYANPYSIPIGGGLDFWGATAPNSAFAQPFGQAISRTTYATLFSLISTTYGAGDGSTTFNLPDKRGRVSAALDNMGGTGAGRLTSGGSGVNGAVFGGFGGAETKTLVTANLPPYTPAGSVSVVVNSDDTNVIAASTGPLVNQGTTFTVPTTSSGKQIRSTGTASLSGTAQGGSSTAFAIVQPTIVCNYIIRVL